MDSTTLMLLFPEVNLVILVFILQEVQEVEEKHSGLIRGGKPNEGHFYLKSEISKVYIWVQCTFEAQQTHPKSAP